MKVERKKKDESMGGMFSKGKGGRGAHGGQIPTVLSEGLREVFERKGKKEEGKKEGMQSQV